MDSTVYFHYAGLLCEVAVCCQSLVFTAGQYADSFRWYCGYVHLPKDHPFWDIDDELDERLSDIQVYGGITYASKGKLGFDTNHLNSPTFNTVEKAIAEVKKLARQLAEADPRWELHTKESYYLSYLERRDKLNWQVYNRIPA